MVALPQDIGDKINGDFDSPDSTALARSVLDDFTKKSQEPPSDRIVRCIVVVANGDLEMLEKAIDLARVDYRDLIVWAEYDEKLKRVRDLKSPFTQVG